MNHIDLSFLAQYSEIKREFSEGLEDFLRLLRILEKNPLFDLGWRYRDAILWDDRLAYIEEMKQLPAQTDEYDDNSLVAIMDNAIEKIGFEDVIYDLDHNWGQLFNSLNVKFQYLHPTHGLPVPYLVELVSAIVLWRKPMHIGGRLVTYLVNDSPLGLDRVGTGWIGWVPFLLLPSDVPEAAQVTQMHGGTVVVSHDTFWDNLPSSPWYSKEALERTQDVEVRLNTLGVLPTVRELEAGTWGQ